MTVGVLALQGGFAAHEVALRDLGLSTRQVRQPRDLAGLAGLVLPGGESTTMLELLTRTGLWAPLRRFDRPVLATCAGAILAARRVEPEQPCLGWLDLGAVRNAWGRQVHSFTAESDRGRALVFIRAPRLIDLGPEVEVVETYEGEPVCVRQGNVTAATFHPELTADRSRHRAVFQSDARRPRAGELRPRMAPTPQGDRCRATSRSVRSRSACRPPPLRRRPSSRRSCS